jgi:hypothetical protein
MSYTTGRNNLIQIRYLTAATLFLGHHLHCPLMLLSIIIQDGNGVTVKNSSKQWLMFWNSVNPPEETENSSLSHSLLHAMVLPLISHSAHFHISTNLNHISSTTNTPLSRGLKRKTKVITDVSTLLVMLFWGMKQKFEEYIRISLLMFKFNINVSCSEYLCSAL